ncbi:UbiA family prenyltransferase [Nocardiopsis sp. RSe5-2]|uniref:UbiA family prenyltransferase n=1 Tax=Nocardiopsis endophytica TaxID=3018445 RepID=A0ABT4U6R4_9ACTN|nr:UbiA family prenyltransferase [Nocardiopsis endophytica]MDA2812406.1 UbiA family prenyltransferase [Nocardiopsis endophytica]
MSRLRDFAELVRLPAALSVVGDTLAGAASAGWPHGRRTWAMPAASSCLYLAGMALNDFADRELDARERPERPLPSGRVRPWEALATGAALTAAGVGAAAFAGGRRGAVTASFLAAGVWAYDLALKPTPLAPLGMAYNRGLDVLMGAGPRPGRAALPALGLAVHTFGVTLLSRGEVHGTDKATARTAVAGTAVGSLLPSAPARGAQGPPWAPWAAGALGAWYGASVGTAQAAAVRSPDGPTVMAATGAGIRGMIPLQAAYIARAGAPVTAAALAAAVPAARAGFRAVSPT